jgi:hypothetical protein
MSAREVRQLAIAVMVAWAVAWGVVYGLSASRAAKAHEAVYWMNASRAASARAAADEVRACSQGGPCLGRLYEGRVRQFLLERGVSPQLQADQDAYVRKFGLIEADAREWMTRAIAWGVGGLLVLLLSTAGVIWLGRGDRPGT